MLGINIADVLNILVLCRPYLIFFGVVLLLAIIALIVMKVVKNKFSKATKFMVRSQAGVAILLALIISVNLICFIPLNIIVSLATGNGVITEETTAEATALGAEIAQEGVVLLKNDASLLPLTGTANLNVFGWSSTNPCYGGTGSGALSDSYPTITLLQSLEQAGFALNTELSDLYVGYRDARPEVGLFAQDWTLPEPTVDSYTEDILTNAKNFSDTAMVVITRVGGEGADLPKDMSAVTYTNNSAEYVDFAPGSHYLELSQTERNLLDMVCQNFSDVIVVYNGANAIELGFVNDYSQIKSVLWCPGTGQNGFTGLAEIINGQVNPSGKTVDTFVTDLTKAPNFNNIGNFNYDNMSEFNGDLWGTPLMPSFVNYVEGIYVGYKFYETAASEGLIDYNSEVTYPFGYGLSYTSFTQQMGDLAVGGDGNISFDVTVTNTGSVAGKDVVEAYYNPPYTNGGIEKSSVNLVAFDKTDLLNPGESQTMTISFKAEDMASYDTTGTGGYVLEAGDYGISIRSDSHTIIAEKNYTVDSTIVYNENNKRSTDNVVATNQFASATGDVTYLSRKDGFSNYVVATAAPSSLSLGEGYKANFINNSNYDPANYNDSSDVMPVTGADNGLNLADMRGLDYDDPSWDPLLDQLTISEMNSLIALGGYQTVAAESVGKYATIDCDGPASINNNFTSIGSIGFPSAVMIACSWNEELANKFGLGIGKMANEMGVTGWYAPAMNIHRSAFAGRNFEYYSEDGLISGKMAANAVKGAEEYGVYAYLKHFALNDQETNRWNMLCTWSNEQAIREIYLKPFEIAVKEGGAKAVMSAYNYIGVEYAGACNALLNTVLRDEWGFHGFTLTDYYAGFGYQDADWQIRNGGDSCLASYDVGTNYVSDTTSATSVLAMRQASKNIMYTVVNSRVYSDDAMQDVGVLLNWQIAAIVIDVILAAGLIALEVFILKGFRKRKANEILKETQD